MGSSTVSGSSPLKFEIRFTGGNLQYIAEEILPDLQLLRSPMKLPEYIDSTQNLGPCVGHTKSKPGAGSCGLESICRRPRTSWSVRDERVRHRTCLAWKTALPGSNGSEAVTK